MWRKIRNTLILLVLVIAALALWKREQITRLMAVNSLFSAERIVWNFSHMDQLFPTRAMSRGPGPVADLADGPPLELPASITDWIADRSVTSLVVLKDGQIVSERYFQGTGAEDRRISWSVAKSFLSALVGILLEEGAIESLDDPVTKYAPELVGSAYDGATLRNVMQMASGVEFDEDYLDFWSDINKMGRILALGGSMDSFAAGLDQRVGEPGKEWHYVSIDTHVIGMVVRGATGRSVPDLLEEKILGPLGVEADSNYVTDGYGVAFVLGGLNLRSRDYARFGQMYLNNGAFNGRQIVPADWVAASTIPSAPTAPEVEQYGLQWWMDWDARPGEYFARGVYGQYIYINQPAGVVIAVNAADRAFRTVGAYQQNIDAFRTITDALQ